MKKNYLLLITSFLVVLTINAQTYEVLGTRTYNPNGWDGPGPNNTYFDSNEDFYIYVSEASQPRTHELVKYDFSADAFVQISNNDFEVGMTSTSHASPFPDGSMYTVTRTFFNDIVAHHYMPDGTYTALGTNPIMNDGLMTNVESAKDSNDNFYITAYTIGSACFKYDGTNWNSIEALNNGTGNFSHVQLHVDPTDRLLATFIRTVPNTNDTDLFLQAYLENVDGWQTLTAIPGARYLNKTSVVSENEIYILTTIPADNEFQVIMYNGTSTTQIGQSLPYTGVARADLIKTEVGSNLYMVLNTDGYIYNTTTNLWEIVPPVFPNGNAGAVTGFNSYLSEDSEGRIYNTWNESNGLTTVVFTPENILSVDEFNFSNSVTISPNPVSHIININSKKPIENVKLFSLTGALVLESNKNSIDISQLAKSMYLAVIKVDGKTLTKKIVLK